MTLVVLERGNVDFGGAVAVHEGNGVIARGQDTLVEQPGHDRGPGPVEAAPGVRSAQRRVELSSRGMGGSSVRLHAIAQRLPVFARPLKGGRHIFHGLTFFAYHCQLLGRVSRFAIVLYAGALSRFIRVSRRQKLDPILDAVFGKDEYNSLKLVVCDRLPLCFTPETCLEGLRISAIVVAVGPNHERSMAARAEATLEFRGQPLDHLFAAPTGNQTNDVAPRPGT